MKSTHLRLIGKINIFLILADFIFYIFFLNTVLMELSYKYNLGDLGVGTAIGNMFYSYLILAVVIFMVPSIFYAFRLDLNKTIFFGLISSILSVFPVIIPLTVFLSYSTDLPYFQFIIALLIPISLNLLMIYLIWNKYNSNYEEEAKIRRTVLDIGIQYPDFTLSNVAKKCQVDKNTCLIAINNMIATKQIFADFFYVSKKFAFNKKANIEEIDKLMNLYTEWETEHIGKKV